MRYFGRRSVDTHASYGNPASHTRSARECGVRMKGRDASP